MDTLATLVERDGPLTELDAVGWIIRLAKRIEMLHRARATHGAICPNAVLVERSAPTGRGALADARSAALNPAYQSPERHAVAAGSTSARGATAADDAWAVAATLYFLVTGTAPFSGATAAEVHNRMATSSPAPLAVFGVDDEDLQRAMDRLLAKNVAERVVRIDQLRETLEAWHRDPAARNLPPLDPAGSEPAADDDDDDAATVMRSLTDIHAEYEKAMALGPARGPQPTAIGGFAPATSPVALPAPRPPQSTEMGVGPRLQSSPAAVSSRAPPPSVPRSPPSHRVPRSPPPRVPRSPPSPGSPALAGAPGPRLAPQPPPDADWRRATERGMPRVPVPLRGARTGTDVPAAPPPPTQVSATKKTAAFDVEYDDSSAAATSPGIVFDAPTEELPEPPNFGDLFPPFAGRAGEGGGSDDASAGATTILLDGGGDLSGAIEEALHAPVRATAAARMLAGAAAAVAPVAGAAAVAPVAGAAAVAPVAGAAAAVAPIAGAAADPRPAALDAIEPLGAPQSRTPAQPPRSAAAVPPARGPRLSAAASIHTVDEEAEGGRGLKVALVVVIVLLGLVLTAGVVLYLRIKGIITFF